MSVVADALSGCLIYHSNHQKNFPATWCPIRRKRMRDTKKKSLEEIGEIEIILNSHDSTISLQNTSCDLSRNYFLTIEACAKVADLTGTDLLQGNPFVTFIVGGLGPRQSLTLCHVTPSNLQKGLASILMTAEVADVSPPPRLYRDMKDSVELEAFPLAGPCGPWLCTQEGGGGYTHFAFPSTYYAIDFRCAVGTAVVAVFSGTVVEVRNHYTSTGPHVRNLPRYNSVMLRRDRGDRYRPQQPLYAEYVHVSREGLRVKEGDKVKVGDVLCRAGDVGFCSEPHLHFQLFRSLEGGNMCPTVPMTYQGMPFRAGEKYC